MRIDGGVTVGVSNINGASKAEGFDFDPRYVTISGRMHRKILALVGFDVYAHMIVIRAHFAEVAGEVHGDVEGISKITFGIFCLAESVKKSRKQKKG
jgi:hypothetical protein